VKFNRGAEMQQFAVESIVGAGTIKAAAIESLVERQWIDKTADYVKASFQTTMVARIGQKGIQNLNKTNTHPIMFFGAREVMAGTLTVGALVAFNMIASQVSSPILRLSQLWQDFQQILVSVERLGDIFRATPELQPSVVTKPGALAGEITLRDI